MGTGWALTDGLQRDSDHARANSTRIRQRQVYQTVVFSRPAAMQADNHQNCGAGGSGGCFVKIYAHCGFTELLFGVIHSRSVLIKLGVEMYTTSAIGDRLFVTDDNGADYWDNLAIDEGLFGSYPAPFNIPIGPSYRAMDFSQLAHRVYLDIYSGKHSLSEVVGSAFGDNLVFMSIRSEGDFTVSGGDGDDRMETAYTEKLFDIVSLLTFDGGAGRDRLLGSDYSEIYLGGAGDDVIFGYGGNDTLDGGDGVDQLSGGAGSDTYKTDGLDLMIETADGGNDHVFSSQNFRLAEFFENLSLVGDALRGKGNSADNAIYGNASGNVIDGKAGADTLVGGLGDDCYYTDGQDTIVEQAGEGRDMVLSSSNLSLADNIETLKLLGSAAIAIGNASDNFIYGTAARNTLVGLGGADRLFGGDGDDTYISDGSDVIFEDIDGGNDVVQSSGSITLRANIENLIGNSGTNLKLGGNALGNTILGNVGNDRLSGYDGNDTLWGGTAGTDTLVGGAGADTFVLGEDSARDVVRDFDHGVDKIDFASGDFHDVDFKQVGRNLVVTFEDRSFTLSGITASGISESDFI